MTRVIFLDAGPLGIVTNPRQSPQTLACAQWLQDVLAAGDHIILPEIADYEVRRELLRAGRARGIARLDQLAALAEYLPLTTEAMRHAAACWAQARQQGKPTASDKALDGDMLLVGQVLAFRMSLDDVVLATTNVRHLSRFVPAALWTDLLPDSILS